MIVPARAGMMLLGMGPLAAIGPVRYTPLCNIVACTYALSTERQLVSTATAAIQVFRTVDNTTANIGFISNGKVNAAAVDAFCNAAVVGVISRNCFISRVFDTTTNACDIFKRPRSGSRTTWFGRQ